MKKYKALVSFSFRDYGNHSGVWRDGCNTAICMGSVCRPDDMAIYCRSLSAYLLEMAHQYDHAKDFCAPEFDKQHREMQLEKVRQLMTPIFEKEV